MLDIDIDMVSNSFIQRNYSLTSGAIHGSLDGVSNVNVHSWNIECLGNLVLPFRVGRTLAQLYFANFHKRALHYI